MAAPLSAEDVSRLLSDPSPDVRANLADKVANGLAGNGLTTGELRLAQDIVRILARDVEAQVRATVSHGLRHSPHLPPDVARRLAEDIEEVALPVLADSLELTDEDLVHLVRDGSAVKHETIASRPNLGETVSHAIITHAAEPAVARLMQNNSARIAEVSFAEAVERFADSERVKEAMVRRDVLPAAIAERLVTIVSRELQRHLVRAHNLTPATASDIVLSSREHAVLHLSHGATDEELRQMVTQMHVTGRLTSSLILRALCTGDIAFFEAAMAARGDVPVENAQVLIHDASHRGLRALYRKAAMPAGLYPTIEAAIETVDSEEFDGAPRDLERFRARVIAKVLTQAEDVDPVDTDYLVNKLADVLVHAD